MLKNVKKIRIGQAGVPTIKIFSYLKTSFQRSQKFRAKKIENFQC